MLNYLNKFIKSYWVAKKKLKCFFLYMNLEETLKNMIENLETTMRDGNSMQFNNELKNYYGGFDGASVPSTPSMPSIPSIPPMPPIPSMPSTPVANSSKFWTIFKIILTVSILSFLTFNIFTYLKTGSDAITYYFGTPKKNINNIFTGKQIDAESSDSVLSSLDLSAAKMSADEISSDSKLRDIVENGLTGKKTDNGNKKDSDYFEDEEDDEGGKDEEKDKEKDDEKEEKEEKGEKETDPEKKYKVGKNYSASSLFDLKLVKTPGYCYIGTDRNVRTCAKVGMGDTCVSGKILPTMDLCVNPNLRE